VSGDAAGLSAVRRWRKALFKGVMESKSILLKGSRPAALNRDGGAGVLFGVLPSAPFLRTAAPCDPPPSVSAAPEPRDEWLLTSQDKDARFFLTALLLGESETLPLTACLPGESRVPAASGVRAPTAAALQRAPSSFGPAPRPPGEWRQAPPTLVGPAHPPRLRSVAVGARRRGGAAVAVRRPQCACAVPAGGRAAAAARSGGGEEPSGSGWAGGSASEPRRTRGACGRRPQRPAGKTCGPGVGREGCERLGGRELR
jgi:hypothetical protein